MKIVLATPLYPPDIAEPAPYVKELARRLAPKHEVTVLAYGRLPEIVPGVAIIAVDKRRPLPLRLISFTFALWRTARHADILYIENGASVELPALIVGWCTGTPILLHFGDSAAKKYPHQKLLLRSAFKIIKDNPLPRPEILPFVLRPEREFAAYEQSWSEHLSLLEKILTNGN